MLSLRFVCGIALTAISSVSAIQNHTSYTCDSPIYCEGPILKTIQLAQIFPDSKTFVDMPTSKSVADVLLAFDDIGGVNATKEQVHQFINDNFLQAGTEIKQVTNINIPELTWADQISDVDYRGWIKELNQAWAKLTFEFDESVLCADCASSSLPVERPFVVPGGRFREFYYWDSYFVIKGLLLTDQTKMAKNMIENFLDFVKKYGFVPNGARIYYLDRSQPPFLSLMLQEYYDKTGDGEFILESLPTLDQEYSYWSANQSVQVKDPNDSSAVYTLNNYITKNTSPRPESYLEDYYTVNNGTNYSEEKKNQMYADLAAGAESGWDYSTRWTKQKYPFPEQKDSYEILRSINTANIVPIDLNSLLWDMEMRLSSWHKIFRKDKDQSNFYKKKADKRLLAMEKLMWNADDNAYYDFNLTSNAQGDQFTPATLFPIWLGALPKEVMSNRASLAKVYDETEKALRKYPGVLTTSYYNSSLQWDFPNGWPPLSYVAMEGMNNVHNYLNGPKYDVNGTIIENNDTLTTSQGTPYTHLSTVLAERYVASAYCGWVKTGGSIPGVLSKVNESITDDGHMFEKFDVTEIGVSGSGGEYTPQTGFGWTNGIAFWVFKNHNNFTAPNCNEAAITINF